MSIRDRATVLHYRDRADSFVHAVADLAVLDAESHAPAIGLLAVHGCIALADAVLVTVDGVRARGQDHGEALRRLRAWCSAKRIADGGLRHLDWLLARKTLFSFDDQRVDLSELLSAKVKMEQFFAWAFQTFPRVAEIREADDA